VGGQLHGLAALPPGNRPGTHCMGGWLSVLRFVGVGIAQWLSYMLGYRGIGVWFLGRVKGFLSSPKCFNRLWYLPSLQSSGCRGQPGPEADHWRQCSTKIKNAWGYTNHSPFVCMAWCLVKHRDRHTLSHTIHMSITNKLCQSKYTGLLLRYASAVESSHPQGVHFTKELWVLKRTVVVVVW
jgi:hypothetical protein